MNGRNCISWNDKFKYDIQYVDNITFFGDCRIVFQTLVKVLKRNDISSPNSATMEKFMGTEKETDLEMEKVSHE